MERKEEVVTLTRVHPLSMTRPASIFLTGYTTELKIDKCYGEFEVESNYDGKNNMIRWRSIDGIINFSGQKTKTNKDNLEGIPLHGYDRFTFTFSNAYFFGDIVIPVIQTTQNILISDFGKCVFKYSF